MILYFYILQNLIYSFFVKYTFTSMALLNLSHIIFSAGFAYTFSLFFTCLSSPQLVSCRLYPCPPLTSTTGISQGMTDCICCHAANLLFIDTYWKGCSQCKETFSVSVVTCMCAWVLALGTDSENPRCPENFLFWMRMEEKTRVFDRHEPTGIKKFGPLLDRM